jgi:hypothetical protein
MITWLVWEERSAVTEAPAWGPPWIPHTCHTPDGAHGNMGRVTYTSDRVQQNAIGIPSTQTHAHAVALAPHRVCPTLRALKTAAVQRAVHWWTQAGTPH